MGISRDRLHKLRVTGGKRTIHRKKRQYELGRLPANTKLGPNRVRPVRCRGGNMKFRALKVDAGVFSWGSEVTSTRTRILDVVYNATSNEMIRTKAIVKGAIVAIDATPFRAWYQKHYGIDLKKRGKKAAAGEEKKEEKKEEKVSENTKRRWASRQKARTLEKPIADGIRSGKLLARIASRPGQTGQANGYILEGEELKFYLKKTDKKKSKK